MSEPRTQIVYDEREDEGGFSIRRMNIEIEIDGRRELVALIEDRDGVRAITTGGETEDRFIEAALEVFEVGRARLAAFRPRRPRDSEPSPLHHEELSETVGALVIAIARAGLGLGRVSPTVAHAFSQLESRIAGLGANGIERFIGRLRNAIEFDDLTECAMLLHGALRFAEDLDAGGEAATERIAGWMPSQSSPAVLIERTFIELGREWVAGLERASIARRYLIELSSGEVFREEFRTPKNEASTMEPATGTRFEGRASLGGAFRELRAGLARVYGGSAPRRVCFDQYELHHHPRPTSLERLGALAERSEKSLLERFKAEHHGAPGQAEPFALFAPSRLSTRGAFHALIDEEGDALPLSRAEGLELDSALASAAEGRAIEWVSGRLFHAEGTLVLRPFMARFDDGETFRLR